MALIVCAECGKKISDTSQRCIHCGAPTSMSVPATEPKPQAALAAEPKIQDTPVKAPEAKPPRDYYKLEENSRIQLEMNFMQQDARAERYRSKGLELQAFENLCYSCVAFPVLMVNIFGMVLMIRDRGIANVKALWVAGIAVVSLIVVSFIVARIFASRVRRHGRSPEKMVYLKKYQAWLLKEKNIKFNPLFESEDERRRFEAVDLEKLDY